jgi:CPA2 family monovalent cation:H+ antiporter-2
MALGAFLAGMLLAETEFSRAIETYLDPFKGLLLGVFFMSVGMTIDVRAVMDNWQMLGLSLIGLVLLKASIFAGLAMLFKVPSRVAVESGLLLSQAGEFGFVIVGLAVAGGLLEPQSGQFMIILCGLSMLITPLLAAIGQRLPHPKAKPQLLPEVPAAGIEGHVIICGYGRVGRVLAEVLEKERIPWLAIESDAAVVKAARSNGLPVWFGDIHHQQLLASMGLAQARGVALTLNNYELSGRLAQELAKNWPLLPIWIRARDRTQARTLFKGQGQIEPVPENLEISLQLAAHILRGMEVSEDAILHRLQLERDEARG